MFCKIMQRFFRTFLDTFLSQLLVVLIAHTPCLTAKQKIIAYRWEQFAFACATRACSSFNFKVSLGSFFCGVSHDKSKEKCLPHA